MAIISVTGICQSYGKRDVLSDLSIDIEQGEILALIGASGSGKTTLLKTLIGFNKPERGTISIMGFDAVQDRSRVKSIIGFTTQDNSFYDRLTVRQNLRYFGGLYGVGEPLLSARIESILKVVGLFDSADIRADRISGGMQRRLDFAISVIQDPPILIMDEPTTGLDPITRDQLWEIITRFHAEGKTILICSHLFDEVEMHATRIAILDRAHIRFEGSLSNLKKATSKQSLRHAFERVVNS